MWTPLSRLPLLRDRMLTPTIEGDDMGEDENIEVEAEATVEETIEKVDDVIQSTHYDRIKIRLGVAVNGYKKGDELTVDRNHPFFSKLVEQGIAEVVD